MLAAPSAERSLKDPQFFPDQRASSAVAAQQQQRALAAGSRQKPQQRAGETGGVSLRSAGRALALRERRCPTLSRGHPLITPSSQTPGKGSARDPLSGGRSVFTLLQGKALSPRLRLPGFTSWRLTMDSGP